MLDEPWQLTAYGVGLFVISASASAAIHGWSGRRNRITPKPGDRIRLRCGAGTYVCTFLRETKCRWVVSPLQVVGEVIPTRSHRELLGTFGTPAGVAVFTSAIVGSGKGEVYLQKPREVRIRDRRLYPRVGFEQPLLTSVNGVPGRIQNMGMRGARVLVGEPLRPGDSVRLLPSGAGVQIWAIVLETREERPGLYASRLIFENEVPLSFCWDLATQQDHNGEMTDVEKP